MHALQLHYTSCRRGQAAGAGFQTRALTPGILPDEVREIERRGLYRPPRDAPQEPTPGQIDAELPRSLRFYTLESGRRALTRSGYAGQDYSGRWGNYFAHTLVFQDDFPGIWPVDLYEWEGWVDRLGPADDTDEQPAPLPAVDLAEIAPGESFTLDELRDFLREVPGRVEVLARMARAVLLHAGSGRPVVVRDTPVNGLYWIACVQKLFPPRHALHLPFSSYQYDPRGAATLNATTGETDFTFGEAERRHLCQLFDPAAGVRGDVPAVDDDYPAIAARWMAESPAVLDAFVEFMEMFTHDQPDGDLVHGARLFHLSRGGEGLLDGAGLSGIVDFVRRHALPGARGRLLEMVLHAARQAGGDGWAPEDHARLVGFLAEAAARSAQSAHRGLALAAWRSMLERCVLAGGGGIGAAEASWQQVRTVFAHAAEELDDGMMDPSFWERATALLPGLPAEVPAFLLRIVADVQALRGETSLAGDREVQAMLLAALLHATDDASAAAQLAVETLHGAAMDPGALADACRVLADAEAVQPAGSLSRAASAAVGAGLGQALAAMQADAAVRVRAALDDAGGWRILYGEWAWRLAATGDPATEYQRYRAEVLERNPGYGQACLGSVMASVLERLPDGTAGKVALEWVRTGEVSHLPAARQGRAVARAAGAVSLEDRSAAARALAQCVARAAAEAGVVLRPDRPRLLEALAAAGRERALEALELGKVGPALEGIDAAAYAGFLEGFLLQALDRTHNRREHRAVLAAVYRAEHHEAFAEQYRAWFRASPTGHAAEPLRVAIKLWLHTTPAHATALGRLAPLAEAECIRALATMEPEAVSWLRDELRPSGDGVVRWTRWETAIEERRRGPLARLGRWGRGLFGR